MSLNNIVLEVLTEFLEVAVHNILHARKIYPDSIFVRKKKYGVIIHKSIHPQLNIYISECIKCAYHLVKANHLQKFVVCFMRRSVVEEKFVFDIISVKSFFETDPYLLNIEQNLRAFCLRLHSSIGYLKPLPDDIDFSIQIHTPEIASVECMENPIFENFPWIKTPPQRMENSKIVPVHTLEADFMVMQVFIHSKTI